MPRSISNLNLYQNEILNIVIHNLSSAPSNPKKGQTYFNTVSNKQYVYNGSTWVDTMQTGGSGGGSSDWNDITSKPTTLEGYGITDATPSTHIGSGGSSHALATISTSGFMSFNDKSKLNNIESGAQVNTVTSVAGRVGAISLTSQDVDLGNVTNESKETMFTSPSLTGIPTAPTPSITISNNQIATTAFVNSFLLNQISDSTPLRDGIASSGTSAKLSREDHVHEMHPSMKIYSYKNFGGAL